MTTLTKSDAAATARSGVPSLVWLILFAGFWIKCAQYFTVPFLAVFLAKNTALSLPVIGMIVGAQPFAALAGGFLGGHLSDKFGRRRILFVSLIGSSLAYFGFFLAARHLAGGATAVVGFALLNLCAGWFASFFWPATQALIADLLSDQQRPLIYRYRYVSTNIGGGLGPLLGVFLGIAAASTAFLVTALSYAAFLVIFYFLSHQIPRHDRGQGAHKSLRAAVQVLRQDRALRWLLLSAILFGVSYAQIESNLSQLMYRAFPDGVQFFSLLITLNAVCVVALQPVAGWVEKRISAKHMMLLGTAVFCSGCLAMAAFPGAKAAFMVGIFVITLGEVLVVPTLSVLVDELAPSGMRGSYFGAASLRQLGPTIGPALGGVMLSGIGATALFVSMALVGVASAFFIGITGKGERQ
ncbi:MAG TPA: MFS transporter [Burkholderiaceae bacterium]|nr:MFS transporter [Burkholderiaceae bacterium]